jgi:threonine dehydrogenase-like Zn-dependent dehydrogenase
VAEFVERDIPPPNLAAWAVRLRIEAAFLPPYFSALPGGSWMTPQRPFTPGQCAIGTVLQAPDSNTQLKPGQRVYCDTYVSSDSPDADHAFMGCFGLAPASARYLARWPNGTFAEEFVGPEHCFTPIPQSITAAPEQLCRVGWFATALAGFRRGGFRPGVVVAINGAAGLLGTSAALVAVAIGAAQVRLIGRRTAVLEEVAATNARLVVEQPGDTTPVDLVIDCAGGNDTTVTEALAGRLRRFGSLVFVGALANRASFDTSLIMRNGNSLIGSFWFPRGTAEDVLALIAARAIDLAPLRAKTFSLSQIGAAIKHSVEHSGGFDHVALKP